MLIKVLSFLFLICLTQFLIAKALYRRALANSSLGNKEKAEEDLTSAAVLAPNDVNIAAEVGKIRQAKKDLREKEKKAYKKLFA